MTTPNEEVWRHNIHDLTEQLYACYARIKVLSEKVTELTDENGEITLELNKAQDTIKELHVVIDGLAVEVAFHARRD